MEISIKQKWYALNDKIRFLFVGGFNACISYLIYSVICLIIGENLYQVSLALAWATSSVISFLTQRTFVFQSNGVWYKEYLKCCSTWFFSYLINAGILEFTVKFCHLNVFLAQFISNFIAAVFTYIVFKLLVFKKNKQ